MSRFPSVGRDQKVKEKAWDDRHHHQPMPDYSPLKDKHTKSYRRMLGSHKKEDSAKTTPKPTTYSQKRTVTQEQLIRIHPQCQQALQEFTVVANKHRIPDFYIHYLLAAQLGPHADPTQNLFTHQQTLQNQTSHYHRISTAMKARQESLDELSQQLTVSKDIPSNIAETINNYRSMTENVIDQVKRWRDSLGKVSQRAIFYNSQHQNCLLALLNDSRALGRAPHAQGVPFAEKNDPFLLVPVKRSEGKERNQLAAALQLPHPASHYQKYMEYLATERAQQLAMNPTVQAEPQKYLTVYNNSPAPAHIIANEKQEPDDLKRMEMIKIRQDRLKKNQQRIKSIKNIYEKYHKQPDRPERPYHSQRKGTQTDTEQRRRPHKRNQMQQEPIDNTDVQFEAMVKEKLVAQRSKPRRLESRSKSSKRFNNKKEDKMIESLKDIQSTLRSKLQGIQQQEKTVQMSSPQPRRTNANLIQQLKQEIMAKIQKEATEKQRVKKVRREQEEKALEEIKTKLKREMEEKLEAKKKEKLMEREELERKLKEEEERLGKQRQLEIQLQLKLTKEKELRELEKIRREALQRERKFKEELEKQQAMRLEQEQTAEKQKRQKQRLIEELKKRELREQLESQLRDEISKGKAVEVSEFEAGQEARKLKQAELQKELELLKAKEGVEVELFKKENDLKKRMLELKQGEQELKRKQIQQLMREAIQTEKQQLQKEAQQRRVQLEESMRANVKEQLLQEHQAQTQAHLDEIQVQRQQQLEEEVYRDKIRDKIEREMRMDAIQRTQKQLQRVEQNKYQIKNKLNEARSKLEKEVKVDKDKIEEEVRRDMIERVIFDKQAEKQAAKNDLRMQFEKELMASAGPSYYQPTTHQVLRKDISSLEGDQHLSHKLKQLGPTNQKPLPNLQSSQIGPSQLKESMTLEQLHVYHKQKDKVSEITDSKIAPPPPDPMEEESFTPVKPTSQRAVPIPPQEEAEYEVKVIRKDSNNNEKQTKEKKSPSKHHRKSKKKPKKVSSDDSDSQAPKRRKHRPKKRHYDEETPDSEDQPPKRHAHNKKPRRPQSSDEEREQKHRQQPQYKSKVKDTDRESKGRQGSLPLQTMKKSIRAPQIQQKEQGRVVHFDVQREPSYKPVEQVRMVPQKVVPGTDKYKISLEAIPEQDFDEYLSVHFGRVPLLQLSVQLHDREQLYRKLINQLTFCLLVGQEEGGRVVGLALAYHDRNRADLRKFNIVHIATYRQQDLQHFVLSISGFIFRKDPADQIEMHYRFDERQADQLAFSQGFNKWFDKHGSVFQKRVEEGIFERKYLLKRQFNQKCEVVLGGVNKNTFRNLFSLYSGVLMSETDMVALKDALVDTLAPEQAMSYAVMVAQLFRTYLTPDQAEVLKNKVKQIAKLKEMLVLVVMMQKKKLRLDELKLYEFKNLIELNMKLMSQGKQIIRHCKDGNSEHNRLYYAELSHAFNLPFHFQTTSLPLSTDHALRHISYFRLSPLPPQQLHIVKSSLYNAQMNLLPTEHSKYKLLLIDAAEYLQLKETNNLDLFMYIRLFLKNVRSHNVAVWKYVWLPEMSDQAAWNLRQFRSFLNKDFYAHDSIHISYRQFLPGALIIQPEHRDLVVTPPFIVGVMSMGLEQVSEGSPLYARLITLDSLRTIEVEEAQTPSKEQGI